MESKTPGIEDAIALAVRAHRGQLDKSGAPYILHPLRVMLKQYTDDARIVAVLHDVPEDTDVTLDDLRAMGYSEKICTAVDCLTHRPGESYDQAIGRAAANPLALRVKLADLEDNMDVRRLSPQDEAGFRRLAKYKAAWDRLRSVSAD